MIADIESMKILRSIVTELFLRGRKKQPLLVFIPQSCFKISKTTRLNAIHYFIVKIPKKVNFNK